MIASGIWHVFSGILSLTVVVVGGDGCMAGDITNTWLMILKSVIIVFNDTTRRHRRCSHDNLCIGGLLTSYVTYCKFNGITHSKLRASAFLYFLCCFGGGKYLIVCSDLDINCF